MLVWVLYMPQQDGSIITNAFTNLTDVSAYVRARVLKEFSSTFPTYPKIGDFAKYHINGSEIAYAVLGQVRFT